jgi:alpha-beta hydrolase superfamily lysophospholipase
MKHNEGTLKGSDGLELFYQSWLPETTPRAVIAFFHGLGGHSGQSTYTYLINYLLPKGYAIYGLDLRGHGRSKGRRGSINTWDDYLSDVAVFLQTIKSMESSSSVFILGQSLGGVIVLTYAMRHPEGIRGVISSAPALSHPNISPVLVTVLKLLAPVWPHLSLNAKLDLSGISRDPKEVEKMLEDQLVDPKISPRLTIESLSAINWILEHTIQLKVPLLLLHGDSDPITPPDGTKSFFEKVTYEDKTLKLYKGGYHQPFVDINRDEVLNDVAIWLEQHN